MNEIKRLKLNLQHFAEDNPMILKEKVNKVKMTKAMMTKEIFELTQSELDSQKHKAVNKALANQEKNSNKG